MRLGSLSLVLGAALCGVLMSVAVPQAQTLPPEFVLEDASPGADLTVPTSLAFFPDGRMVVTEKTGRAWIIQNGVKLATPLWEATNEILENGDRGLISVAVDPNYVVNHYVYFSYVVDPDSNGVDDDDVAFGRVTRYRTSAADSNVVDPASRTVLLGTTWSDGVLDGSDSHTIDALRWGADGSLLLSAGEGALYTQTDAGGLTPNLFLPGRADPYQDIGSFRSQSVSTFNGKVIRIDPLTGHGYPSNPYYDGDVNSIRSKVWAYGCRNPWRFSVRPGTGSTDPAAGRPGTLYVGNVGQNSWESLVISRTGGENFGWPCYEGPAQNSYAYIVTPAHNDCGSNGTPDNPAQRTAPSMSYSHTDSTAGSPAGFIGNGITGGSFYYGTFYPLAYRGQYFFADLGAGWIRTAVVDTADHVVSSDVFATGIYGIDELVTDPATGDLYLLSAYDNTVRHIRFTGLSNGDHAPIANATASVQLGTAPLAVNFSSAGSSDPDGDPYSTAWNFGDATGSTALNPAHSYSVPGIYNSILTLDDHLGGIGRDTARVVVTSSSTFPTTPVLDDFNRADGPMGPNWYGGDAGLTISSNTLGNVGGGWWAVWDGPALDPNEEVYFSFVSAPVPTGTYSLYLKSLSQNPFDGCIRVRYDSLGTTVSVHTYQPNVGWILQCGPYPASFGSGDRFGARFYTNGVLQVMKNGAVIATADLSKWYYIDEQGYVGLEMVNTGLSRIDDFGGGAAVINGNLPPVATITSPANGLFYTAGDSIRVRCTASDDANTAAQLKYRWDVDLNHNNHVHPDVFVATNSSASFLAQNHDDGTGVSYSIRLKVTDTGGLSGTKSVQIWPNVDLRPVTLLELPDTVTTSQSATYRFTLRNAGTMPAPFSHWQLTASNGVTLAQGDTIVAAGATVTIQRVVPPLLPAGRYTLRVMVDTLNTVHESNETNNSRVKTLIVKGTVAGVDDGPEGFRLAQAYPNPSRADVTFAMTLPQAERVTLTIYDLQGREVWSAPEHEFDAGAVNLVWPGRRLDGAPVRAGLYLARVRVGERTLTRRFAVLR